MLARGGVAEILLHETAGRGLCYGDLAATFATMVCELCLEVRQIRSRWSMGRESNLALTRSAGGNLRIGKCALYSIMSTERHFAKPSPMPVQFPWQPQRSF